VTEGVTPGPSRPSNDSMTTLRAALPLVRALILAGIVTMLIMIGLPAILGIAAAAA
jgi:hypothetical protein